MTNIERNLTGQGFARIHRSAIINLDRVHEIAPLDSGDARVHLANGEQVPVSRRYRHKLTHAAGT